ncbi:AAA family ATPase [Mycobacterium seoulense]|uniref:helix-turn-helix transcriptional regulator n=1 Tax=Mycobacterium seoulense TaxID=386911 RepID=UPI003CE9F7F9
MERIVGRQAEERALVDFLDSALRAPSALIIEGEPGIGKTTLWLDAVDRARERAFRVLTGRAAAAESVLAYTTLADLLSDVDPAIWAELPEPQRHGLDAALLRRRDTQDTDARAVAAAFVAVLDQLATQGPVIVAIDDLQWLDTSSANVISFAARRLPPGAALLCTLRTDEAAPRIQLQGPDATRRIRLQPLTVGELHQLLTLRLGSSQARPMLLRIHEISGGNPFFGLELARELENDRRTTALSLPGSLGELVSSRIGRVSGAAGDALLAMASLPDPTVQMVAQAIDTAPDRVVELLGEAETQSVVVIDGNRLRFTHPVLAHGVYNGAPPRRRRAMHRRLAEVVTEPELRARHLALSDTSGEPQTMEALDTAAETARSRGAPAAAAELLELAIALGGDTPERRISCAQSYFFAGDHQRARQLLEKCIQQLAPGRLRAEAVSLLAVVRLYDEGYLEAADLLQRALSEVGDELNLRVPVLVMLSWALFNAGRLDEAVATAHDAVGCARQLGEPHPLSQALSMRVLMDFLAGDGFDEESMQTALELADNEFYVPMPFRPKVQNALLLAFTGQLERASAEMRSIRRDAMENGDEGELSILTFHRVLVECWRGNFAEANLAAEDTMEIGLQVGRDLAVISALIARGWLGAYAGREAEARRDVTDALAASRRSGTFRLAQWAITALGFLELSLGNSKAALDTLQPLLEAFEAVPGSSEIVAASFIPDAAEALIGLDRCDDAEPLIDALERNGRRLDRAWMLAVGARCRAMLLAARGDLTAATDAAERAMTEHERLPMPFERARTLLLLGQLQRRQRRRDAAQATFREALATFERLGTTLWADRAKAELARGTSGRRRAQGLTPSEQRVAELALAGMTNRDIAAALFISPKTVEVNLSRIYRKLNIRSRTQLSGTVHAWRFESDM